MFHFMAPLFIFILLHCFHLRRIIIRPHCRYYAAYCYRPSNVVCLSVCHTSEPCKNGWTNRDAVLVEDSGGPREPCIRWGARSPMERQFWRGKGRPIVKYRTLCGHLCKNSWTNPDAVWLRARMVPRNHGLDGGPEVLTRNFGTEFAITGIVWTIATMRLVMEGGWLEWSVDKMQILPIICN